VPRLDGLACVDWGPPQGGIDAVNIFVFGGSVTAEQVAGIRLPPDELSDHVLVGQERIPELMPPQVARRMAPTLRGMAAGHTVYLEDGREPAFAHR
jgi:8-oxo-dGTP diphosphatase